MSDAGWTRVVRRVSFRGLTLPTAPVVQVEGVTARDPMGLRSSPAGLHVAPKSAITVSLPAEPFGVITGVQLRLTRLEALNAADRAAGSEMAPVPGGGVRVWRGEDPEAAGAPTSTQPPPPAIPGALTVVHGGDTHLVEVAWVVALRVHFAPSWLLAAQAIDGRFDATGLLAERVHLRVMPSPLLGLPARPARVYRVNLGQGAAGHTDAPMVFVLDGLRVTPPVVLHASRELVIYFPTAGDDPHVWARVEGSGGLTVTGHGVANGHAVPLVKRDAAPWDVAFSHLTHLVVRGPGTVTGCRALRASRLLARPATHVDWWKLPHPGGRRYLTWGADDALSRSEGCGQRRRGLHESPEAAQPQLTPVIPFPAPAERSRLAPLTQGPPSPLLAALEALIEGAGDPFEAKLTHVVFAPPGEPGELEVSALEQVAAALMDPGLARWLGFGSGALAAGQSGDVVAYVIGLRVPVHPDGLARGQDRLGPPLAASAPTSTDTWNLEVPQGELTRGGGGLTGPGFRQLWVVAATTLGQAPLGPPPLEPSLDDPGQRLPPEGQRAVRLKLEGLVPGAGLALARVGEGGIRQALNPAAAPGRRAVIFPSGEGGTGEVEHHEAPSGALTYAVAQCDWFGRFGLWSFLTVPALPSVLLPVPLLRLSHRPPASFEGDAPAAGTVDLFVPVPPLEEREAGSLPLASVEFGVLAGALVVPLAPITAQGATLHVAASGPPLAPTETAQLRVRARFRDAGGTIGSWSDPVRLELIDPRPPPPLVIDHALRYAARADATGRAVARLAFDAPAGVTAHVYGSDETRLLTHLDQLAPKPGSEGQEARALRDRLADLEAPQDRAAAFVDAARLFPRALFERLTTAPVRGPFNHPVDGGLGILLFYKVVPVSDRQVEGRFEDATLVPRGVPDASRPPRPLLSIDGRRSGEVQAVLQGEVPSRGPRPVRYRLRRSRLVAVEPVAMPVVAEGPIVWLDEAETRFELTDAGASVLAPEARLLPWTRYAWVVEVQDPDAPGSTGPGLGALDRVGGLWSAPSSPATMLVAPPPPAAPAIIGHSHGTRGVAFRVSFAGASGGEHGATWLTLYTLGADGALSLVTRRRVEGSGTVELQLMMPELPPGSRWQAVLEDPLGRQRVSPWYEGGRR